MRRPTRAEFLADVIAFGGPLALFVAVLVPGVAFWDTGEMQTVPTILGIAHPTGFPAFILLGWLGVHAVPFESPAWRMSLLSACAAAGAAWLLSRFIFALVRDRCVAVAAALAYATGDVVWTRSARAEVHDLALFFTALALTLAARAGRERDVRSAARAAAAFGCGLATHPVVVLALPSLLILAWPCRRRLDTRALASVALAALGPLVLYLYIPLRSGVIVRRGLDPAVALGLPGGAFWNYEQPATPGGFVHYALGASFAPAAAFGSFVTRTGFDAALAFARTTAGVEFGVVTMALALTGFVYLAFNEPRVAAAFAALWFATGAFVPNFHAESDALRYALPALWASGVCAGAGAAWLMRSLTRERTPVASALAAALLAIALWPSALYAARDALRQRKSDDARAFNAEVVRRTADGALVIATWTYATPLAYAAYVGHTFGRRTLVSGWPGDYAGRYAGWRKRFAHIYFVVPARSLTPGVASRLYSTPRWELAELRR